jgi:hypothetical protein
MLHRVGLVGTDVSEERIATIITVQDPCHPDDRGDIFLQKGWFLQKLHGVTSQKTAVFTVIASNPDVTAVTQLWKLLGKLQ